MTTVDQPTPPSRADLDDDANDIVDLGIIRADEVEDPGKDVDDSAPLPRRDGVTASAPVPPELGAPIRQLLNRYELAEGENLPSVIAVVSALRGEGVTTVSRALAEILATDFGARVCWLDLSWEGDRSRQTRKSVPVAQPGISEVLRGDAELDDIVDPTAPGAGVQVLHGGDVTAENRHRLARRPELDQLIERLHQRFDYLVLDVAPILSNGDALALLRFAEAYILVARYGVTTTRQLTTVAAEISTVPSIGAILNQYRSRTPKILRRRFSE